MRIALTLSAITVSLSVGCAASTAQKGGCPFGFDRLGGERPAMPATTQATASAAIPTTRPGDTGKQPGAQLAEMVLNFARRGQADAIGEYLSAGYSPNFTNAKGDTPLILAAYHGNADVVRMLLSAKGIEVDAFNSMGFTALTGAAFKGSIDIARQLMSAGADVNAAGPSGKTPLMFAALAGKADMVDLLVSAGADASRVAADGSTAAGLAASQGNEALAAKLQVRK
jgi:hypothetical protein